MATKLRRDARVKLTRNLTAGLRCAAAPSAGRTGCCCSSSSPPAYSSPAPSRPALTAPAPPLFLDPAPNAFTSDFLISSRRTCQSVSVVALTVIPLNPRNAAVLSQRWRRTGGKGRGAVRHRTTSGTSARSHVIAADLNRENDRTLTDGKQQRTGKYY